MHVDACLRSEEKARYCVGQGRASTAVYWATAIAALRADAAIIELQVTGNVPAAREQNRVPVVS